MSRTTPQLPAAELVVPQPAPRPLIRKGDDARLALARALAYGDQNAARLGQADAAYRDVAARYEKAGPQ